MCHIMLNIINMQSNNLKILLYLCIFLRLEFETFQKLFQYHITVSPIRNIWKQFRNMNKQYK